MAASQLEVARYAQILADTGEPISFYDAFMLVKRARLFRDLDDTLLSALMAVRDVPAITVGGKRVLGDFVRAAVKAREQERILAARVIKRTDSNHTVRARVGQTIALGLFDTLGTLPDWRCVVLDGPAELSVRSPAQAAATGAQLELELTGLGVVMLELALPASIGRTKAGHNVKKGTTFKLRVIVERA